MECEGKQVTSEINNNDRLVLVNLNRLGCRSALVGSSVYGAQVIKQRVIFLLYRLCTCTIQ